MLVKEQGGTRKEPVVSSQDGGGIKGYRRAVETLVNEAQDELDRLYRLVREACYVVLLCDEHGVVIDHRGDDAQAAAFARWRKRIGSVRAEEGEGADVTGTCINEPKPVTGPQDQHFLPQHLPLCCSAAPVFGPDGKMAGALCMSSVDPTPSEHTRALTGALALASARSVEERLFRERFGRLWILSAVVPSTNHATLLLAVDDDQRIVGADRNTRNLLLEGNLPLGAPVSLWTLFERDAEVFSRENFGHHSKHLKAKDGAELWPVIVTSPARPAASSRNAETARLHTQLRLDDLINIRPAVSPRRSRGGLSPAALRRVREYMGSHLSECLDLQILADVVGLSLHHFARAFKQSTGVPPHTYLLQRRIDCARDLLIHSDRSLSEVALLAGFGDQSHFSRRFRELVGVSPGQFRRSQCGLVMDCRNSAVANWERESYRTIIDPVRHVRTLSEHGVGSLEATNVSRPDHPAILSNTSNSPASHPFAHESRDTPGQMSIGREEQ
jgi:AraC-like DNA-binding protein